MSGAGVLRAVMEAAGEGATLIRHVEKHWNSATFSGARHTMVMSWDGERQVHAGSQFIEQLEATNFTIPGVLVADATVQLTTLTEQPERRFEAEIGLLVLDRA